MTAPIRVGILTVSDRCSRGQARDLSGPALARLCRERLAAEIVLTDCVPDDPPTLEARFREWSDPARGLDLILSTGGTGLAPRDHTPEAAMRVIERPAPGLMELARLRCSASTARTFLSRGVAGVARQTLIITLPGSVRGATENLEALLDLLPHAIETLRGQVQDDGRPDATPVTGRVVIHDD